MADKPEDLNIEEVFFETKDALTLHAWYLDNNSDKTVLFFHGNAGNLSHRSRQLEVFNELGLNALIFDYREYGKSEGKIQEESDLYLDAEGALNYLVTEKKVALSNIILWGRSLGGAIAIDTAQNKKVFAVIIESTFSSMDDMARTQFWFLPTTLLSKFHFRSNEKIKNIDSRLLIMHSKEDEIIPFSNGRVLLLEATEPKTFSILSGSHNDGFLKSHDLYLKAIKKHLSS